MQSINDKSSERLAIDGGIPVRTRSWLDNFTTGEDEKKALSDVIDSGYLSMFEGSHTPDPPFSFYGGPRVQAFEAQMCEYYEVPYAVAVNSATSGLYAAIGALGIGFGDEVIVSPYTMSACAVAPIVYGAIPIFADVELETGALCPKSLEAKITPRTKAILVVHQFGIPADMDGIMAVAARHRLRVIEDCAQAHGARYKGMYVGTIGDIGVFSFNVNKTIQSGEGGVCVTKDPDLAYRLALIRNHGEAVVGAAGVVDITNMIGFNYRMTELQAAVCIEQMKKLPALTQKRLALVERLSEGIAAIDGLVPPRGRAGCKATYYVYPLRYLPEAMSVTRDEFVKAVKAEGVMFFQGYVRPLYLQPIYQRRQAFKHGYPWSAKENEKSTPEYSNGACPNAERLHFEEMMINEHVRPPHDERDISDIVEALTKVARKWRR
jgi:perosamine synthetase